MSVKAYFIISLHLTTGNFYTGQTAFHTFPGSVLPTSGKGARLMGKCQKVLQSAADRFRDTAAGVAYGESFSMSGRYNPAPSEPSHLNCAVVQIYDRTEGIFLSVFNTF